MFAAIRIVVLAVCCVLVGCGGDKGTDTNGGLSFEAGLVIENAGSPAWAPDGKSLLFVPVDAAAGAAEEPITICEIAAGATRADTVLVDPSGALFPKYLPDGRHIVYLRTVDVGDHFEHDVVIHDLQGGEPVVRHVPDLWTDARFQLSFDGTEIVYTVWDDGHRLRALRLSDGSIRNVVPFEADNGSLSPDGDWVAFGEDGTLFICTAEGEDLRVLGSGGAPCWTPDGETILFSKWEREDGPDLFAIGRDGSNRRALTDDAVYERFAEVSPDGKQAAYTRSA
jgi:Tol biopolymer transport system component